MKLLSVFRKAMREQLREVAILIMVLVAAPFFVFIYWMMYQGGAASYTVAVVNQDAGEAGAGRHVIEAMKAMQHPDGSALLKVREIRSRAEGDVLLRNREADGMLIIPPEFSVALQPVVPGGVPAQGTAVTMIGDMSHPRYSVAAIAALTAVDEFVRTVSGVKLPVGLNEEFIGGSGQRSEFELYVPGLLLIAVVFLLFKVAMVVTAEVEAGTLRRLKLSKMTAFDLLGGISLSHLVVGVVAVMLTFWTAAALGFQSQGPLLLAILVACLTTFAVIGFGLWTACYCKTTTEASVVGTFPTLGLMFFSGAAFPMPKLPLFDLAGHAFGLWDVLPTSHAVVALNKVLTLGAGIDEIGYELTMVTALSALYFAVGVWLFHRRHMRLS